MEYYKSEDNAEHGIEVDFTPKQRALVIAIELATVAGIVAYGLLSHFGHWPF